MPPRSSFTSSFSATDANNEVLCPLKNHDGSNCRKRCLGEKRYRSMQEHIRRAHPQHYISKLPATEESFQLMINTPPSELPPPAPPTQTFGNSGTPATTPLATAANWIVHGHDRDGYAKVHISSAPPPPPRTLEDQYPAAATAAVALAQLHNHNPESGWDSEADYASENEAKRARMHPSVELPPIQNNFNQQHMPPFHSPRPRELLPSMLAHSPPGRSLTLPPIQRKESLHRTEKQARPRKGSITQNSRKAKHEKSRSKDNNSRRVSLEGRKAFSAEPPNAAAALAMGKRWEDLIEAATSATEADSDRDLTPIPQSPLSAKRASLPPFPSSVSYSQSYKASPLQNALTPPPQSSFTGPTPFPSVETSMSIDSTHSSSGHNFHIPSSGLSLSNSSDTTSPTFYNNNHHQHQPTGSVQIYCANCRRLSVLGDSYACTECISGFCSDCVYTLSSEQRSGRGRMCPRCRVEGGRYKPFKLDLR